MLYRKVSTFFMYKSIISFSVQSSWYVLYFILQIRLVWIRDVLIFLKLIARYMSRYRVGRENSRRC